MKSHLLVSLTSLIGLTSTASAIKIDLRYDYDTNNFFGQAGSKEAMRAVADFYESLIHDSLLSIDESEWTAGNTWSARPRNPSTGTIVSIPGLVVPADTIIIYVGARALGTAAGQGGPGGYSASGNTYDWFDRLDARGQTGALADPATDAGPWGGSIAFDTGRTWNFSLSSPDNPGTSFVSVALHEIGHLLGIGTEPSWTAKCTPAGFTGPYSTAVYGGNVPLQDGYGHWQDEDNCGFPEGYDPEEDNILLDKAFGSFGAPHGFGQIALMDPSTCSNGTFHKVMTDLDLAGLRDIGWEIHPPAVFTDAQVSPAGGPFYFSWPSTSGFTYRVQKSTSLAGAWETLETFNGDGTVQDFTAPTPTGDKAFYRLNTSPPAAAAAAFARPDVVHAPSSREPVTVNDCGCGAAWGDH